MHNPTSLLHLLALPAVSRFDEHQGPMEVEIDSSFSYLILGGLQQIDPNLKPLAQGLNHRFAVMFRDHLKERLVEVLGEIRDMGGLSPVKLVSVSEDSLYVVLDARTSTATVQKIGAIWSVAATLYQVLPRTICFASESDICSNRSDLTHPIAVKEILDSHLLGVWPIFKGAPEPTETELLTCVTPQSAPTRTEKFRLNTVTSHFAHSSIAYYLTAPAESELDERKKLLAYMALSSGLRQPHLSSVATTSLNHRPSDHICYEPCLHKKPAVSLGRRSR
ncbi:hypothetical protein WKQ99_17880 [Pseudomonas atacamensis]|uniref:hypothetical protein n=1 Tax=Pseudomonas atacamensis TaxID=2565368 RepID=UPI0030D5E652